MSESYVWKSNAEYDPYSGQRQLRAMQQRNQQYAAELAQIRRSKQSDVEVPENLRIKTLDNYVKPSPAEALKTQQQRIALLRSYYM